MYSITKRVLDLLLSLTLLVILSPVLIPTILALLLTGEHEVFYLQDRVGLNQKTFRIWKFATMVKNSPNIGTGSITLKGDPRVTKVGKYLRKTKVNELPQLINVLLGNMTLVGPRPQMKVDFDVYTDEVKTIIGKMKPGITGAGSIFFRDEESDISNSNDPRKYYINIIAPKKGLLEVWYYRNKSLWIDVKLLFLTVVAVLSPKKSVLIERFFSKLIN